METGKTSKYFKYAIGEIILVVIGILIALQINNWNENRKSAILERKTLRSLKTDLESALPQLNFKIKQNQRSRRSDSVLLDAIHYKKVLPLDSIQTLVLSHVFSPGFDPELGTLNEILNTGKMGIIQNDSLRNYISNWNKYMDELHEVDAKLEHFNLNVKTPLYLKKVPMKNKLNGQGLFTDKFKALYPRSNFKPKVDELLLSFEFENMLSNYIFYGLMQKQRLLDIRINMQDMIRIINDELRHD